MNIFEEQGILHYGNVNICNDKLEEENDYLKVFEENEVEEFEEILDNTIIDEEKINKLENDNLKNLLENLNNEDLDNLIYDKNLIWLSRKEEKKTNITCNIFDIHYRNQILENIDLPGMYRLGNILLLHRILRGTLELINKTYSKEQLDKFNEDERKSVFNYYYSVVKINILNENLI